METIKTMTNKVLILLALLAICSTSSYSQGWKIIEFPSYDHLTDIEMISADTGLIITASGYCFRTQNRGKNWNKSEIIKNVRLESLYFENSQNGWVCGHNGSIFKTKDGGNSWSDVSLENSQAVFFDIEMKDSLTGLAVGMLPLETNRYNGIAVRTIDGGKNWQEIEATGIAYSEVKQSRSKDKILFMAMGRMNISSDNGESWESVATLDGTPSRTFSIYGATGILAGPKGALGYSNDSGKTWFSKKQDEEKLFLCSILLNKQTGYVAGSKGVLMVTYDAGLNWAEEETPLELSILDLSYVDGYLFAAGSDGLIMYRKISEAPPKN